MDDSRVVCFNDTATTESYTDWHPLSLHDALPSFIGSTLKRGGSPNVSGAGSPVQRASSARARPLRPLPPREWRRWTSRHRSEEHTSELQSLMRISYAVFCLKKKKEMAIDTDNTDTTDHHTTQRTGQSAKTE